MSRRILVTGGAGYIGSHTCKLLSESGYEPVTLDNLVYGHKEAVQWGPFEMGDINDADRLAEIFRRYEPQGVIHFAAFAYVGESVVNPGKYYQNNVSGTISLLEAMRATDCRNIIFSSTCATYGVPSFLPITEASEQKPINPYGFSKLMIEQILKDYDTAYGVKHTALRYFNAAGADTDGDIGELHEPETHLIPLILEAALGRRDEIEIFGTDYNTPDGTAIRDYVHVTDLAQAHVLALGSLDENEQSDQFNLGTGVGISVKQAVKAVEKVVKRSIPIKYSTRRAGDPSALVARTDKAAKVLGWKASNSDLETIVKTAYDWHVKRSSLRWARMVS